jgi:hypothetical protein
VVYQSAFQPGMVSGLERAIDAELAKAKAQAMAGNDIER